MLLYAHSLFDAHVELKKKFSNARICLQVIVSEATETISNHEKVTHPEW